MNVWNRVARTVPAGSIVRIRKLNEFYMCVEVFPFRAATVMDGMLCLGETNLHPEGPNLASYLVSCILTVSHSSYLAVTGVKTQQ